jgi:putative oxidoreductase
MLAKIFDKGNSGVIPLVIRIGVGLTFFFAGWSKLGNFAVPFFTQLGIPAPGITGPFITLLEMIGGLCILLGIGTRFFSLLLIGDMVVAILAARLGGQQGLLTLGLPGGWNSLRTEFLLMLGCLALLLSGPGAISVERSMLKREIP